MAYQKFQKYQTVTITVSQHFNPRFDSKRPVIDGNAEHTYHVEKAVNTLEVKIGQYLTPGQVQALIDEGHTLNIVPVKG